jgi:hypothetical protein
MKSKYYPPKFGEDKFHCIHCQVFASQRWSKVFVGNVGESVFMASQCAHCHNITYWYNESIAWPDNSPTESVHPDLPSDCAVEFEEARNIFSRSPRAAAALLRLCLQKLMPHLGENGKNINDDIKSLVSKGLSPLVQKALDYCRVIGNNAVHPGEIIINDTPDVAQKLFSMINLIVEDRITRPKEVADLYDSLPEDARKQIEIRDKKGS